MERYPRRSRFGADRCMGHPRDHRGINQYPILLCQQSRSMNALFSSRDTDDEFTLRDTIIFKMPNHLTRLSNNRIRRRIVFRSYEREMLTTVMLGKRGAILGDLR
jgi:hypothetical protein